ncbi:BEM_HP_G0118560.mRNA.1.CDS.1 [Saccharomyces cerevisiae]|nr:BEM_HP_G0118560.mRNA.1.CDS.1 [Saccharomyces cerevisiae]CAI6402710.1 BEM_HP_G0118560.mRNA.1.CDS.1 [Saccharomyces cerevisiae]
MSFEKIKCNAKIEILLQDDNYNANDLEIKLRYVLTLTIFGIEARCCGILPYRMMSLRVQAHASWIKHIDVGFAHTLFY